jgi:multisubunit Na+/H+ antiporter MnhC subunit
MKFYIFSAAIISVYLAYHHRVMKAYLGFLLLRVAVDVHERTIKDVAS